ncbi:MAG: hypothetical protein V4754_13925 [Pseudomonadota bacterium]
MSSLIVLRKWMGYVGAVALLCAAAGAPAQQPESSVPQRRELSRDEQIEVRKALIERFHLSLGKEAQFAGAGAFRFASSATLRYIDRSDTGSVAFENPQFGIWPRTQAAAPDSRDGLIGRVDGALRKSGLSANGMRFARFQEEYAASAPSEALARGFDPRKNGTLVARSALYERQLDGVPVFGSELLIGLMPDGSIGRLRLHWPKIEARVFEAARALQVAVRNQTWKKPEFVTRQDTEILDVSAGVGHAGFADLGARSAAVVRIVFRTRSTNTELPLQTTGYKFFDEGAREITFHSFTQLAATPAERKAPAEADK